MVDYTVKIRTNDESYYICDALRDFFTLAQFKKREKYS